MSIRVALAIIYIIIFSYRAWRGKWFEATCASVLLMAAMQHPDMPKSLGGIQGMNLWNILILNVVLSWIKWRKSEGCFCRRVDFDKSMAIQTT